MIYGTLQDASDKIIGGERNLALVEKQATDSTSKAGFAIDYFNVCNADTLKPATPGDKKLVILVTTRLGDTRLLDNIEIDLW